MIKKIIVGILSAIVVGLGYLLWAGQEVVEISTEIEIAASPEQVWEVVTNIDSWEKWSPVINKSSGKMALGSQLSITMVGPDQTSDGSSYQPKITSLEAPNSFKWRSHMVNETVFTNDKVIELQATAVGTKLIHKELFSGMLAAIFCSAMEKGGFHQC